MEKIDLFKKVVVVKNVKTKSMPSTFVPKGTIGHVLEIRIDKNGEYDYLLEMVINGEEIVDHLHQDEIEELV